MAKVSIFITIICLLLTSEVKSEVQPALWEADALIRLEENGFGLSDIFPTPSQKILVLKKNPLYLNIVDHFEKDLTALQKADPKLSVTMATSHRLFNIEWLRTSKSFFELTGIVNRADRQPFHESGSCGEIRLVYRLAYTIADKGHDIHSRLPFTVSMVFVPNRSGAKTCVQNVKNWETFLIKTNEGNYDTKSLLGIDPNALKSIEINMQSVRWPSTTRGDLAGHAEYLLRVFHVKDGKIKLAPLENTPDVERIKNSPVLKQSLLAWIKNNLEAINTGTAIAPENFLAKKATSVSPRGLTRISNRPWSNIFKPEDLTQVDFNKLSYLKSPEALLRRLDDSSCIGCHQNRSVAGFHLLGIDRTGTSPFNSIAVPGSPHFMNDLKRRSTYLESIKNKAKADEFRPLSERTVTDAGDFGAHCGLGDPGFKDWTCSAGLSCKSYGLESGDKTVGQCFSAKNVSDIGEPCEIGKMIPHLNPYKDKVKHVQDRSCGDKGVCEVNYVGFPEGMCAEPCGAKSKNMKCGSIAILVGFNSCLGKGIPFTKCLAKNTRPTGLRACSIDSPCRDDYICSGSPGEAGTCIPPYFLFQMRVDGHPKPK